jgi:hypothetical protein
MKKHITLLLLMLAFSVNGAAGDNQAIETAEAYFMAVKAGDVAMIQEMTGAPLLEQIDTLLTDNAEYPEFLRSRYEGASAVVSDVGRMKKGMKQVDLTISYADNRQSLIELTLSRKKAGKWKVIGQQEVIK